MTSVYTKNQDNKVLDHSIIYLNSFFSPNSLKVFYKKHNANKKFTWQETDLFSFLAQEMLNASDEARLMMNEDEIKVIKRGQEIVDSWKSNNVMELDYYYFTSYEKWVDNYEEMSMAIGPIYETSLLSSLAPKILKTNSEIKNVRIAINAIITCLKSTVNKKFALPLDICKIEFHNPDYIISHNRDGLTTPFIDFLKSKSPPAYDSKTNTLTATNPVKARDIAAFLKNPFTDSQLDKETMLYTTNFVSTHQDDFLQSITFAPPPSTDMLNVDSQLVKPQKAYFIFVPHYQNSTDLVENHNVFLVSSAYLNSPTDNEQKTDNSLFNLSKISNSQLFESVEEAHKYAKYYGHQKDYIICEIDFAFNRLIPQTDLINSAYAIQDKIAALVEKEKIQTHLLAPLSSLTLEEKVKYYEEVLKSNNLEASLLPEPQVLAIPQKASSSKVKNKV